jgi:hypothetical protein
MVWLGSPNGYHSDSTPSQAGWDPGATTLYFLLQCIFCIAAAAVPLVIRSAVGRLPGPILAYTTLLGCTAVYLRWYVNPTHNSHSIGLVLPFLFSLFRGLVRVCLSLRNTTAVPLMSIPVDAAFASKHCGRADVRIIIPVPGIYLVAGILARSISTPIPTSSRV